MASFIDLLNSLNASLAVIIVQTKQNALVLFVIIAVPWLIFAINSLCHHALFAFGLIPRHIRGLPGIIFSPLLHAHFDHLFFNSIPLLILSDFLLIHGLEYYLIITMMITLVSGSLIWCFAKPGVYIGASAVITGYWAFLVCDIYQQGTLIAIILGLGSLYYLSGIFYGLFPGDKKVSWQGHMFGFISGIMVCFLIG